MADESDLGFHIDHDGGTPIASEVYRTFEIVLSQIPEDAREFDRAILGQIGYAIGASAELERRLAALEEIVRAGMGPQAG